RARRGLPPAGPGIVRKRDVHRAHPGDHRGPRRPHLLRPDAPSSAHGGVASAQHGRPGDPGRTSGRGRGGHAFHRHRGHHRVGGQRAHFLSGRGGNGSGRSSAPVRSCTVAAGRNAGLRVRGPCPCAYRDALFVERTTEIVTPFHEAVHVLS